MNAVIMIASTETLENLDTGKRALKIVGAFPDETELIVYTSPMYARFNVGDCVRVSYEDRKKGDEYSWIDKTKKVHKGTASRDGLWADTLEMSLRIFWLDKYNISILDDDDMSDGTKMALAHAMGNRS